MHSRKLRDENTGNGTASIGRVLLLSLLLWWLFWPDCKPKATSGAVLENVIGEAVVNLQVERRGTPRFAATRERFPRRK